MGANVDDNKEPQAWREIGGAFAASFVMVGLGTLVIFHGLTIGKVVGGGMLAFSAGWFLLVRKVPL